MAVVETTCILRDHVELAAENRESFAVDRVCVACCVDFGPCGMDGGVDAEGGLVDGFAALYYVAVVVYEDEVGDFYLGEML